MRLAGKSALVTGDLNLNAYFVLAQEVGREMLRRRSGSIINVTSVNGALAFPKRLAYCVWKAGANMLTNVLAIEWAASGVRVNAIAPGYIETSFVTGEVLTVDGGWSAYGFV